MIRAFPLGPLGTVQHLIDPCIPAGPTWNCATPNRSVHSDFPKSSSCACVHREHHAGALAAHVCVQIVVGATANPSRCACVHREHHSGALDAHVCAQMILNMQQQL